MPKDKDWFVLGSIEDGEICSEILSLKECLKQARDLVDEDYSSGEIFVYKLVPVKLVKADVKVIDL